MSQPQPAPEESPNSDWAANHGTALPDNDHLRPKPGTPEYQKYREQREKEDRASGAEQYLEGLLDPAD